MMLRKNIFALSVEVLFLACVRFHAVCDESSHSTQPDTQTSYINADVVVSVIALKSTAIWVAATNGRQNTNALR